MAKMTKAQAGRIGGMKTHEKYGSEYMREIAKRGAKAFHAKYKLQPVGTSDFLIVHRDTGESTGKTISGVSIRR